MLLPELVYYDTPEEYRQHYLKHYCRQVIYTFDGVRVFFRSELFAHAFYEASNKDGKKDVFSRERAERINWIKATLENPEADIYQGYDKRKNRYDAARRVSVVYQNFVVVIDITHRELGSNKPVKAKFVTAYLADNYAIDKIRKAPRWS